MEIGDTYRFSTKAGKIKKGFYFECESGTGVVIIENKEFNYYYVETNTYYFDFSNAKYAIYEDEYFRGRMVLTEKSNPIFN